MPTVAVVGACWMDHTHSRRLMALAPQAALNSSRGAAFGFAGIAALAGDAMAPHLGALLPRLYRYMFDPSAKASCRRGAAGGAVLSCSALPCRPTHDWWRCESRGRRMDRDPPMREKQACAHLQPPPKISKKQVRDAMRHIWMALCPDTRAALTAHFGPILASLLKELGGGQWRVREAAAAAIAELLQARRS